VAEVVLDEIDKVYDNGFQAVFDLSLEVHDGEFLVLVGPSGCGKTTALRMVAGLEDITDGTLTIGGRVVNELSPKERDVAMVFQNYALYPHLSVADNIAFGLRLRKTPSHIVRERVAWASKLLGLEQYLDRKPKQLSGGQRQRVAMGRAIVREPQRLYDRPANLFVASFIGSPAMNLVEAQVRVQNGSATLQLGENELRLTEATLAKRSGLRGYDGRTIAVGIRPENVDEGPREGATLHGRTILTEALGSELLAHVEIAASPVVREEVVEGSVVEAEEQEIAADLLAGSDERRTTIVGRLDPGAAVRPGENVQLSVATEKLHYFDLETGLAIDGVPAASAAAGS
jgi:ABC-type sugar transport system ATPase subunit